MGYRYREAAEDLLRLTMRLAVSVVAAATVVGLSGCYTSDHALIGSSRAAAPFRDIVLEGDPGHWLMLVKRGTDYVSLQTFAEGLADAEAPIVYRFSALSEPGYYAVQALGGGGANETYYYAIVRIDLSAKVIQVVNLMPDGTALPTSSGVHKCGTNWCIDDLDAFAQYGLQLAKKPNPSNAGQDAFKVLAVTQ